LNKIPFAFSCVSDRSQRIRLGHRLAGFHKSVPGWGLSGESWGADRVKGVLPHG